MRLLRRNRAASPKRWRLLMSKPKVAFYWCASCGGCEETVVDLAEDILGVVEKVDIVLWPVAMDFKYKDIEAMPDKSIAATLLNGAIRSTEQEEMAHLLRRKSQFLIAYGSCAVSGGIPGLANQFPREQILKFNYEDCPDAGERAEDPAAAEVRRERPRPSRCPQLHNVVRSLDQVVEVDYYVPGCPPTPNLTKAAMTALLEGKLPPKGSVLAPDIALCDECPRKDSQARRTSASPSSNARTRCWRTRSSASWPRAWSAWGRPPAAAAAPQCTSGNMPCTGCFGPTSRVRDQGAQDHVLPLRQHRAEGGRRHRQGARQAFPTPSAPSTATAWPRACCAAK